MRKLRDPTLCVVWCIVAAIGILGLAVALLTMVWSAG